MSLTATLGMPGSGKSTWAMGHADRTGARLFSTDAIRTERRDVVRYLQSMQRQVDMALAAGDDVVVDACNVKAQHRRLWLNLGRRRLARCVLVIVDTDPDVARKRNLARPPSCQVPADRMDDYAKRIGDAIRAAGLEPWSEVLRATASPNLVATSRQW